MLKENLPLKYWQILGSGLVSAFGLFVIAGKYEIEALFYVGGAIWLLCGFLSLRLKCPRCGKSIIMPDGSIFNRIFPEEICSRCGLDLTK